MAATILFDSVMSGTLSNLGPGLRLDALGLSLARGSWGVLRLGLVDFGFFTVCGIILLLLCTASGLPVRLSTVRGVTLILWLGLFDGSDRFPGSLDLCRYDSGPNRHTIIFSPPLS
jgi:hypothetical protein